MTRRFGFIVGAIMALAIAESPAVPRQQASPESPEQPAAEAPPPAPAEAGGVPDLDELLGITKPAARGDSPAPDRAKEDLERRLSGKEISDQFEQAVAMMSEAAERLGSPRDTGLTTQRVQADILNRLDKIIKAAEQNQQPQQGQQQPQPGEQDPQQQNQPNQGRADQGPAKGTADEPSDEGDRPKGNDAVKRPDLAARGAAWGALPQRVREALFQGRADPFSAQYQRQTEAYYRRLAEEKGR